MKIKTQALASSSRHPLIRFYSEIFRLKLLYRQGWIAGRAGNGKVPEHLCESVAEHSYAVALIAMILQQQYFQHLNLEKVLIFALIHDLAEAKVGDLMPFDKAYAQKKELEATAMKSICHELGSKELLEEFKEYEQKSVPEAIFVYQVEKLETLLQGYTYYNQKLLESAHEWFDRYEPIIQDPTLAAIVKELRKLI